VRRKLTNVVAFDDAPFSHGHRGEVPVVGAVCAGLRLDGVLIGRVRRDGANAARNLVRLVSESRFARHVQLVMLQGVALAGFNVVDVRFLSRRLDVPVLVVSRKQPDMDAVREALLHRVPGGAHKWKLIELLGPMEKTGPVFVQRAGLSLEEARILVDQFAIHGHIPEPLRIAHLIAGALGRGESAGRV